MAGMFTSDPATYEGKYLVVRRDGTIPPWPHFVLGGADPDAPGAIRDYADRVEKRGRDPKYVADLRQWADLMEQWQSSVQHKTADPDSPRHRTDDPLIIAMMRGTQTLTEILERYRETLAGISKQPSGV